MLRVETGAAGLEPAKPLGRLIEGQAALPFAYAPSSVDARGETRTLNVQFLRLPPLPFGLRARPSARGGSRTRTETLFERAASAVWATRAEAVEFDTGGETRTHMSRLLRTVCLPFAPLPRVEYWGRESNPQWDLPAATSVPCVCLYATPARRTQDSGGRTRTLVSRSKDGRPPSGRPRTVKRTRQDSNLRPQAPQACALNPSELRVRKRRRCDSNAQGRERPAA